MKKLIAATLVVLMVFTLVACGGTSTSNADQQATREIEEYIEKNRSTLISSMESSFASSSGMTCSSSIEVEGRGFIVSININELDDVDDSVKSQMQSIYDAMQGTFDGMLKDLQAEVPVLEYFKILVCEKDGDVIATISAQA